MMDGGLLILLCSQLLQKTDSQIFWGSRYDYGVMVAYYYVCAEYLCSS